MAHIVLVGGPFDREEAFRLPPDVAAPAQIVWGGWMPWGFDAWLYEWRGERTAYEMTGPLDTLVYRATGRRLGPDEIPYDVGTAAETYVDATILLARIRPLHPKLRLP